MMPVWCKYSCTGYFGHPLGFIGQVDRALLDDAVDVVSPGVVIQEAVDGQFEFVVQAVQEPADAARGLAAAVG